MEAKYYTLVRKELERYLTNVKEEIDPFVPANAKTKVGSWENSAGTVMGYLSYYPKNDPQEESIDVTLEVELRNESGEFTADICWTGGEIIAELIGKEFDYASLDSLKDQIRKMTEEITPEIVFYFKNRSTT